MLAYSSSPVPFAFDISDPINCFRYKICKRRYFHAASQVVIALEHNGEWIAACDVVMNSLRLDKEFLSKCDSNSVIVSQRMMYVHMFEERLSFLGFIIRYRLKSLQ